MQPKKVAACLIGGLIRTSKVKSTRPNRVVRQGKAAATSAASAPSAALTGDDSAASAASTASAASDYLKGLA